MSCKAGGGVCAGLLGGRPGWLDEIADDDQVDFTVVGAYALCGGQDTRASFLNDVTVDCVTVDFGVVSPGWESGMQDEIAAVDNDLATKAGGEGNGESEMAMARRVRGRPTSATSATTPTSRRPTRAIRVTSRRFR